MDFQDIGQALLRWAHVIAGIVWIGHLYFFNWVNGPFAATLDKDTKPKVVPELMPRALFWFRWGAAWTWITGLLLAMAVYYHGGLMFDALTIGTGGGWGAASIALVVLTFASPIVYDPIANSGLAKNASLMYWVGALLATALFAAYLVVGQFAYRAAVIHVGMAFGTLMAFNVWYRIWPAQQKIIAAIKAGQAPDAALAGLAGLRSKHNTYMSIPLVWMMLNAHTTAFSSWPYAVAVGGVDVPLSLPLSILVGWWFCAWCYRKGAAVKGF